jgi:hypothetical protein
MSTIDRVYQIKSQMFLIIVTFYRVFLFLARLVKINVKPLLEPLINNNILIRVR